MPLFFWIKLISNFFLQGDTIVKKFFTKNYLQTYFISYRYNIIENFYKIIFLNIIIGILVLGFYHFVIPYNHFDLSFLAQILKIEHLNDQLVIKGINRVIGSFTIGISLLSAIYVFTYREQKSISPSGSTDNHKNTFISIVLFFMILNIIFGWLIGNDYTDMLNEPSYVTSLKITEYLFYKVFLIILSLTFLIILAVNLIKYLFRTMSVDKMLSDSVLQSSKLFNLILLTNRSKEFNVFLDDTYRKFHFSLESVFQNIKFAADNNMNKEFEENIEDFKKVFNRLNETITVNNIEIHVSTHLLREDKKFLNAYQSAIRSNLSLISHLLKNQQYNKAEKAVSLYFNMYIDNDVELNKFFKSSLSEFLDFIDTSDERQLSIYINGLSAIPEHETLIAYNFLLIRLINKSQLKNLTNIVYMLKNNIKNKLYEKSVLVIVLQNLMKSIEISNYGITGFLVKFLLTNYSGKEVNTGLIILKKTPKAFTRVLEADEKIEGIVENRHYSIVMNDETFDYCYKKGFILLFAQRLYSTQKELWYINPKETGMEIMLRKEFEGCNYSDYIITKVRAASSKYGLLFFEDKIVMRSVYNELNLSYPDSKEVNKNFPETFDLLVRKLFKL